jgi:two-component system, cell cycle sensor histidine kinase and response regulator CckA
VKRPVTEFTRTPARLDRVQDFIARATRAVDGRPEPPVSEPDYHALIQHSSDMMFLLDAGGHIRFAGPSCTQILGYTPEELLGRSCFALIHPGELSVTARALTTLLDEPGGTRKAEFRLLAKDGSWHWIEGLGTNLLSEPKIRAIVVNSRDITERKRAEIERQVFFEVIHALNITPNLDELLVQIHSSLRKLVHAENCYVALYEPKTEMFHFHFFVDQFDSAPPPQHAGRSCTAHVFRTGKPLLMRQDIFARLVADGEIEPFGTPAPAWLGVPLRTPSATLGVLVVQHYTDENAYTERDLDLLNSIGGQIALAIERKQAEDIMHKQQKENEIMFHAAPYMIWYKDTRNRILRANRTAAESIGLSVGEVEGRSVYDLFPSEAVRYHQDDLDVVRSGAPKLGILQPYRLPSGEVRLIRADKVPYRNAAGEIVGVVVFSTDVTERQRAEDAMRRSEVNYRSVVQGAPYGICRASERGQLFNVNPALVQMLGYASEAELLEVNLDREVFLTPPERVNIVSERGESFEGAEVSWKRKDDTQIQVRLSGRPVRDPEWPSSCYELIAENVTEQRALEKQLRQAQKMEAVGRLAGGVAHDFNNLLMVIQGHAELVLDRSREGQAVNRSDDAWYLRKVEQIQKAAERASALTRQLLAFSRMQVLQSKVIALNDVVTEMGNMLPRLIGEDIELKIVAGSHLGRVKADSSQMEQVVLNLAVNARDAMPKGGRLIIATSDVEVDDAFARRHPPMAPGPYVRLTVSDTGVGMDPETQAHIFEPFFTTKEVGKGTGLGLATVYGVVKQSGGYVWVNSEKNCGTTFKVYLPRVQQAAETPPPSAPAEAPTGSETILLAEDEKEVREIAREFLSLAGYTILEAHDGAAAVEIAQTHEGPIHLLITDMVMPKVSGRELAEVMAELRPETKVIYMSGYTEDSATPASEAGGKAVMLNKPFTRLALARAVNDVLKA